MSWGTAGYTIADTTRVKHNIYDVSEKFGISHLTVQTDAEGDRCYGEDCRIAEDPNGHHGHSPPALTRIMPTPGCRKGDWRAPKKPWWAKSRLRKPSISGRLR